MTINFPQKSSLPEIASILSAKSAEIEDMYLVVPFKVDGKELKVVNDDVHMMIVGKDKTEVELEMTEQDGKIVLKALDPDQRNIIHEEKVPESQP